MTDLIKAFKARVHVPIEPLPVPALVRFGFLKFLLYLVKIPFQESFSPKENTRIKDNKLTRYVKSKCLFSKLTQ